MQAKFFYLKFILSVLMVLSGTNALWAKDYQVELVFFEHLNNAPSLEGETHVEKNSANYPRLINFNRVDNADLQLSDEAKLIRGSRNFRLLKHVAWSQEGLSRNEAGSVNIARWIPQLRGKITLYLNRYLHLDLHIESQDADGIINTLHERRRLRSKTTHYIDSPKIGIIARITSLDDIAKIKNQSSD